MAVSYVDEGHNLAGSGDLVITLPTFVAGDLAILIVVLADETASLTTPTGWTAVSSQADATQKMWVYYRVLQGGDTTVTAESGAAASRGVAIVLRGQAVAGVYAAAYNTGADGTPTNPGITAVTSGILIGALGSESSPGALPAGYTASGAETGAGAVRIRTGYIAIAAKGATGTATWGATSNAWTTWAGFVPDSINVPGLFFGTNC